MLRDWARPAASFRCRVVHRNLKISINSFGFCEICLFFRFRSSRSLFSVNFKFDQWIPFRYEVICSKLGKTRCWGKCQFQMSKRPKKTKPNQTRSFFCFRLFCIWVAAVCQFECDNCVVCMPMHVSVWLWIGMPMHRYAIDWVIVT